jgi:hypothetical protein
MVSDLLLQICALLLRAMVEKFVPRLNSVSLAAQDYLAVLNNSLCVHNANTCVSCLQCAQHYIIAVI